MRKSTKEVDSSLARVNETGMIRSLNVSQLLDEFFASLDVKEITKTVYRKGLQRFMSWRADHVQDRDPDRTDILAFKNFLIGCKLAANTVNNYLVAVKRFFSFLESTRRYPNGPKT